MNTFYIFIHIYSFITKLFTTFCKRKIIILPTYRNIWINFFSLFLWIFVSTINYSKIISCGICNTTNSTFFLFSISEYLVFLVVISSTLDISYATENLQTTVYDEHATLRDPGGTSLPPDRDVSRYPALPGVTIMDDVS